MKPSFISTDEADKNKIQKASIPTHNGNSVIAWADDTFTKVRLDPRQRCCFKGKVFVDALKAMTSRLMFMLHSLLTWWRVTGVTGPLGWIGCASIFLIFAEAIYIIVSRKGQELKWICPSVICYLVSVIPGFWILELSAGRDNQLIKPNVTHTESSGSNESVIEINSEQWNALLEQTMLVLIIIARWLMPKGVLTREQLSALLLLYLGTASDCVDFFSILAENHDISYDTTFRVTVLFFYSWSLLQFVFNRTSTKEDDADGTNENREDDDDEMKQQKIIEEELEAEKQQKSYALKLERAHKSFGAGSRDRNCNIQSTVKNNKPRMTFKSVWSKFKQHVLETEVWSILVALLLQDGPFLAVRLIATFYYNISSYTHVFFTIKNALVILLNGYRLVSINMEYRAQVRERKTLFRRKLLDVYRSARFIHNTQKQRAARESQLQI